MSPSIRCTEWVQKDPIHKQSFRNAINQVSASDEKNVSAREWSSVQTMLIFTSAAVGVLAACAATTPVTGLNGWIDTLIDTQLQMNSYLLGRDSIRDAIEVSGVPADACNPARAQESYERISRNLTA
jgi:hypothetical protein